MRVFVTGGAGFIGSAVCRSLRGRGDEVVAAVREPARASGLDALGCQIVRSDLASTAELETLMAGVDSVVHLAGSYRIGIRPSERPAMEDANVGATIRVLHAGGAVGVARIIHVSTANVYGNTRGQVVDETYRRDLAEGFLSAYDETKYRAHRFAEERIAAGAPIIIVLPGGVYGPGDRSQVGGRLHAAFRGRLHYQALADVGLSFVHVDDVATGILAALDRGALGQEYILAGPRHRLREAVAVAARLGRHRPPLLTVPTGLLRALAPLSGAFGRSTNLAEVIAASDGVTYWVSPAKAMGELDYAPRDLESGLRATFGLGPR